MNSQLFILSLIEIILSIVITVIVIFISYKILTKLFFKESVLQKNNTALSVFISGFVLSIGLILSEILPSITNVIRISAIQTQGVDFFTIIKYSLLYLLIGFIVAALINAAVFFLFSVFTKGVNEFEEIKNSNVSVAILVVAILISITLIAKESIALLISSLMPYPEATNFL